MPENADTYWLDFGQGVYSWTLQTYLRLKADGFPCELTQTLPSEGIVLAHRGFLPFNLRPSSRLLIVCLKADYEQHPYAQLHIVQNPAETKTIRDSYYMPHWSQPGLISRDEARGDQFENVAYFGLEKNIATELQSPSWQEQLDVLGLRWYVVSRDRWHDYSNIDAIVAVRSFNSQDHTSKPATKLYNAWNAGVPAILGCESAYIAERKSELDYLEVASPNDAILALKRLRDHKKLRHAMILNGKIRAEETNPKRLVNRWRNLLIDGVIPVYERWCKSSNLTKQIYWASRQLEIKEKYLQPRYQNDFEYREQETAGIQEQVIISMLQLYNKGKVKIKNILS